MFDINKMVNDAKNSVNNTIQVSVNKHKKEMMAGKIPRIVTITVRDRDHFYAIVKWCNKNCGQGSYFWTVKGRVLRNIPCTKDWLIFTPWTDISPLLAF